MRTHFVDPISLSSAEPLWEYPGNSLISADVNARIVYGGMESPLGMSRHPQRPVTVHRARSEMPFHTKNEHVHVWDTARGWQRMCIMHN